jgi:DNA polymerase-1
VARTNFGLKLTPQEAAAIHATYRVTYPGVPMYWKRQIKQAKVNGYVETLAGRRVWTGYKADWQRIKVSTDGSNVVENVVDNRWQAESTAINYPVQGTGADQKYLSLKVLRDYLPSVEGRWYYELHDGVFVIVPNRYADKAAHELKQIMSNLPYEEAWGVTLPIQFPVDVKLGPTWAQMREVH